MLVAATCSGTSHLRLGYRISRAFGESAAYFQAAVTRLGLVFAVLELELVDQEWKPIGWVEEGVDAQQPMRRVPLDQVAHLAMPAWLKDNRSDALELAELITGHAFET